MISAAYWTTLISRLLPPLASALAARPAPARITCVPLSGAGLLPLTFSRGVNKPKGRETQTCSFTRVAFTHQALRTSTAGALPQRMPRRGAAYGAAVVHSAVTVVGATHWASALAVSAAHWVGPSSTWLSIAPPWRHNVPTGDAVCSLRQVQHRLLLLRVRFSRRSSHPRSITQGLPRFTRASHMKLSKPQPKFRVLFSASHL